MQLMHSNTTGQRGSLEHRLDAGAKVYKLTDSTYAIPDGNYREYSSPINVSLSTSDRRRLAKLMTVNTAPLLVLPL